MTEMTKHPEGLPVALPAMPANISHVTRRVRACEGETPAQLVLEHAMIQYATAAIIADRNTRAAQAAQPGWQMVPVEPTPEMVKVGAHVNSEWLNDNAPVGEHRYLMPAEAVYKAMIAAAPKPPQEARQPLSDAEIEEVQEASALTRISLSNRDHDFMLVVNGVLAGRRPKAQR